MYTTQTLFNTVAAHLLTQGRKATVTNNKNNSDLCRYRGDDNTKCAIGCLIPDELYQPRMEGRNIASIAYDDEFGLRSLFTGVDTRILPELQLIHDTTSPEHWANELAKVAVAYKLDADILNQL